MTRDDEPRLARALALLGAAFNESVDGLKADAYALALADLPIDAIEGATAHALRTAKFFPRPAELRAWVEGGGRAELAEVAWLELERAMRQYGSWHVPPEDALSPEIWDVIHGQYGDWAGACEIIGRCDSFQQKAILQREFVASYQRIGQGSLQLPDGRNLLDP